MGMSSLLGSVLGSSLSGLKPAKEFLQNSAPKVSTAVNSNSGLTGSASNGVVRGNGNYVNTFRAYGYLDSTEFDPAISGYVHVFMTRPSMNTNSKYINLIQGQGMPLVPIITSLCKGFPENDYAGSSSLGWENYIGRGIKYGKGLELEMEPTFSLEFNETQDLLVTRIHTDWMQYIYDITMGKKSRSPQMFARNTIDYAVSFFVFLTKPDGKTITYWSKYTGVFPEGISTSGFAGQKSQHSIAPVTINYTATAREIMKVEVLQDFIAAATNSATGDILDGAAMQSRPLFNGTGRGKLDHNELRFRGFKNVGITNTGESLQLVYY